MKFGQLYINFNDVISSDLNIGLSEYPSFKIPSHSYETIEIANKRGQPIVKNGSKPNLTIECTFYAITKDYYWDTMRKVREWLKKEQGRLIYSESKEYYYEVLAVEYGDLERQARMFGTFKVSFICYPYEFAIDGNYPVCMSDKSETDTHTVTRTNLYNVYDRAYPDYKIIGYGDFTIELNDASFSGQSNGNLTINTRIMETYQELNDGTYGSMNIVTIGEYTDLWLENGLNKIKFTCDKDSDMTMQVIPHWGYET